MTPGRLNVGIIGTGHVGPIMALALAGAGHNLTGIAGSESERLDALLPDVPRPGALDIIQRSDLVVFAIPGSEMKEQFAGLTKLDAWKLGQLVLHTAPEHGVSVFGDAISKGIIPLALSPALVFTGTSLDLERLKGASIAVTAPAPVLPIAQALALEIGGEPVIIAEENRAKYADTVAGARDMAQLVAANAVRDLREMGIDNPTGLIGPVVSAALAEQLRATQDGEKDPYTDEFSGFDGDI